MSYSIATSTIDTRAVIEPVISAAWVALGYTADTIEWPNVHFTKPGNGPWIRVSYTDQSSEPFTYGGGVVANETICVLQIQIFAPKNMGAGVMHAAADKFRATFERQNFGAGIIFMRPVGPQSIDDAVWAGVLLNLPFTFFEAITI